MISKKILAFIICTIMISNFFIVYADSSTFENDKHYESYVSVLEDLGMLGGDYNNQDDYITKKEVASTISKLFDFYSDVNEPNVNDVSKSNEYYSDICKVVGMQLMDVNSQGAFYPDNTVSKNELADVFARIVCYDLRNTVEELYKKKLDSVKVDILKKLKSATVTKNDFVMAWLFVLDYGCFDFIEYGTNYKIQFNETETILSKYKNIYRREGLVTGNECSNILTTGGAGDDRVTIDDFKCKVGKTDIFNMLGYNVVVYLHEDDNDYTVAAYYPADNETIRIPFSDLISYKNDKISYYNGNKTKIQSLSKYVAVIYNGIACKKNFTDDLDKKDGYITLLDNNNDGQLDIVFVDVYESFIVSSIDWDEGTIFGKYNQHSLSIDEGYHVDYYLLNEKIDEDYVKSILEVGDVVTAITSDDGGIPYRKIHLTFEDATARIKSVNTSSGEISFYDGRTYKIVNSLFNKEDFALEFVPGDYVNIYINFNNEIFHIEKNDAKEIQKEKYGYLLRIGLEGSLEKTLLFQIYVPELDETLVYQGCEKIRFNGDTKTDLKIYDVLSTNFSSQLIRYAIKDGKINILNTAAKGKSKTDFSEDCRFEDSKFAKYSYIFSSKNIGDAYKPSFDYDVSTYGVEYCADGADYIFYIGDRQNGIVDEEDISIEKYTNIQTMSNYDSVTFYDTDELNNPAVIVIEGEPYTSIPTFSDSEDCFLWVVKRVYRALDSDGNERVFVDVLSRRTEYHYYLAENVNLIHIHDGNKQLCTKNCNEYDDFIQEGDIIQLTADSKGRINYIRRLLTFDDRGEDFCDKTIFADEGYNISDFNNTNSVDTLSNSCMVYGRVNAYDNNTKFFKVQSLANGDPIYVTRCFNKQSATVYTINRNRNSCDITYTTKLEHLDANEVTGDLVLVNSVGGVVYDMVIIK